MKKIINNNMKSNKTIDFNNSDKVKDQLEDLLDKIDETELILIKCHLLVEFSMNTFITNQSRERRDISNENFTFSQKIKICRILGLFADNNILEDFILLLNKLRNQISHTLSYDKVQLDELCLYTGQENKEIFLKSQLRLLSCYHSGRIVGRASNHRPSPTKEPG